MRIAVIGAGVVGVTTAWELALDGHEVTVFERRSGVAAESSFGHPGLVVPGLVTPWAAPGLPQSWLKQLWKSNPPLRIEGRPDLATLRWLWRWSKASTPADYAVNRQRLLRLAQYSRDRLRALARTEGFDYERAQGCLMLLRSGNDLKRARPALRLLAETGLKFSLIDAAHCRLLEPGLNADTALQAGVYLPDDEAGNCRLFSNLLRAAAQRRGVQFVFQTDVRALRAGPQPEIECVDAGVDDESRQIASVQASVFGGESARDFAGPYTERFDAVVVCAALGANELLQPLGLKLPLAPVWGYSVTAPLRQFEAHPDTGPRSAIIDQRHQVVIARLGQRLRVAGGATIGGRPGNFLAAAIATLYKVLDDWFPGAAQVAQAQRWKGARPTLPDGPPVLGASGVNGIWLNLGHGEHGWALACGSARVVADAVAGRKAAIDVEGLDVSRLR